MTTSVVEFGTGGHYFHYLRLLIDGWRSRSIDRRLVISVRRTLLDRHPELVDAAADSTIEISVISPEMDARIAKANANNSVSFASILPGASPDPSVLDLWLAAQQEVRLHGADRLFLMEIDRFLPAIAAGLASECPVSGIWFKPRFHYRHMGWPTTASASSELAQKWLISRVLANPRLERVLFLDRYATQFAAKLAGGGKALPLTDPCALLSDTAPSRASARAALGLDPKRFMILFFGLLSRRKGLLELIEAVRLLPKDIGSRVAICIAGMEDDIPPTYLTSLLEELKRRGAFVVFETGFVEPAKARLLFAAANLVSVLYREHIGMSGVLLSAAANGRPVMAQAEGLIGHLVKENRLGVTVANSTPGNISAVLETIIEQNCATGFNRANARHFAESHHPDRFVERMLQALT